MSGKKDGAAGGGPAPAGGGGGGDSVKRDPKTGLPQTKLKKAKVEAVDVELDYNFTLKPILSPEFGLANLELCETINVSSLGRVRLVKCLDDEKYYALKMSKKSKVVEFKQLRNLVNEVGILSRLRCVYAPELKAVFQDENSVYIMSEYVAGGELFSHLRKAVHFEEVLYQFYATEIACAIAYLHALNITYRGLKPESIQITQKGHVRLSDFSFAKKLTEGGRTFTLCGTPEYVAPEILEGKGYGRAADWWAVGILIYEMAVGFPCFFSETPFGVYRAILECVIRYPPGVDVSDRTRSVVNAFVNPDRGMRLGCGEHGFQDVKFHPFFKGIDWNSANRELVSPPVMPTVITNSDTSNYDYYDEMEPEDVNELILSDRVAFNDLDTVLGRKKTVSTG